MYDMFGSEIALKYHTDDLMQQAERERQMQQAARSINPKNIDRPVYISIGFTRTPDTRFGRIVIEGGLK